MTESAIKTMQPGLRPGDKLKHFEVQEQLGAGGMGIVWRGYDRLLDRFVAIKQIATADNIDEISRQKFRHEADFQKKLSANSPNLVQIIDLVDDPRGIFMVMEYVDGPSLERLLAQTPNPIETLKGLVIIRDSAMGLAAIHAAGAIHRDLKPGNILLTPQNTAKLCDFGLATLLSEQEAMNVGTAQYMAPELFTGGAADGRADIYSLGMVAYEMLAGRAAFEQAFKAIVRDQRNAAMRWMKWHTNTRIAAPPLHTLNPQVPEVLSDLVGRMMAKDPAQRIESGPQLVEAIKRHFSRGGQQQSQQAARSAGASAPGGARPSASTGAALAPAASAPATAPLPKRKNKMLVILAALVALQALAIGGYFMWQGHKESLAQQAVANQARGRYEAAEKIYKAGDYPGAKVAMDAVVAENPLPSKLGIAATAYGYLADTHVAMTKAEEAMKGGDYKESLKTYNAASDQIAALEKLDFPPNATAILNEKDQLDKEINRRKPFVMEVDKIVDFAAAKDYDNARRSYIRLRDSRQGAAAIVSNASEQAILSQLNTTIEEGDQTQQVQDADDHAASLLKENKLADAKKDLDKNLKRYPTAQKLKERLKDVTRRLSLEAALADAAKLETAGKLTEAVAALERANAFDAEPSKERADKIAQLRGQIAFKEGQALEAANDTAGAAAKYQKADSLWPNELAKARLAAMAQADQHASLLAAADSAVASNDFKQAISLYEKAQAIENSAETATKVQSATVRMHVKTAEDQLTRNELEPARAELKTALGIDPKDEKAGTMLMKIDQIALFNQLVADANKARAALKYAQAKTTYQKAIDLAKAANLDAAEIIERKVDTEYDHLIAQARAAMEVQQWKLAHGFLAAAQNMRSNPQVDDLVKEVEAHVKREGGK
jgi:tRNA A-37 threonylcarbamoyl transferase component Bud32/tetratricopeptide (TPR) repeat protein